MSPVAQALIVISEYLEYFEESTRPEEILALADICKVRCDLVCI